MRSLRLSANGTILSAVLAAVISVVAIGALFQAYLVYQRNRALSAQMEQSHEDASSTLEALINAPTADPRLAIGRQVDSSQTFEWDVEPVTGVPRLLSIIVRQHVQDASRSISTQTTSIVGYRYDDF